VCADNAIEIVRVKITEVGRQVRRNEAHRVANWRRCSGTLGMVGAVATTIKSLLSQDFAGKLPRRSSLISRDANGKLEKRNFLCRGALTFWKPVTMYSPVP
jgi:hypothetical protein